MLQTLPSLPLVNWRQAWQQQGQFSAAYLSRKPLLDGLAKTPQSVARSEQRKGLREAKGVFLNAWIVRGTAPRRARSSEVSFQLLHLAQRGLMVLRPISSVQD